MSTKEGLEKLRKKYNIQNGWKYGGGRRKKEYLHGLDDYQIVETSHSRYFENMLRPQWIKEYGLRPVDYLPTEKEKCICEHFISENCFIYKNVGNQIQIRVIGNCCIKKFDLQGRRCKVCDAVHKNRKDNYCNSCRKDIAEKEKRRKHLEWYCSCGKRKKNKSHPLCVSCYFNN